MSANDDRLMSHALELAKQAQQEGEVPVGAIVVQDGNIVGQGYNKPIGSLDPTAHAEIVALRMASQVLGNYRLPGCELYVTLEPCAMCAGAIIHARIARLIFGAYDIKTGACGSVINLFENTALNHHTEVRGHVQAEACGVLLAQFFANKRK